MSNTVYTVALAGCGGRGRHHAKAFQANDDRFELKALCDINPETLEALGQDCEGTALYADADRMLEEVKPDVFCFCTDPHVRLPLIKLGIKHKVKAIAYEKPMAVTLEQAREIRDLCNEAGIKTIVSHQHKYGAHWQKVRELVESGELGEFHTIHATAKGWLTQYGTHLFDYMNFLNNGGRAKWVIGHVQGTDKLTDSHPSPDYTMAQFEFENGVRGILECGTHAPDQPGGNSFWMDAGATVYGSEGYARAIVGWGWQASTRSSQGIIQGEGGFDESKDQPPYIRDLADWLDDPAQVHPCNGDITYHGFELIMGACLSGLEHRTVDLPLETDQPIIERLKKEL